MTAAREGGVRPGPARFAAPWDRRATRNTLLFTPLLLVVALALAGAAAGRSGGPRTLLWVGAAVVVLGLALCAAVSPRGYLVDGAGVTIEGRLARTPIPGASIEGAEVLPADALAGALNRLGSGGLFGYLGHMSSPALGRFRAYATRSAPAVVIRTRNGAFLVTPDRPEAFVAAVAALVGARR